MYAYHFQGYWKDVGTIPALWEANMEVLDPEHSGINLFDDDWKVYSRNSGMHGHTVSADAVVRNSMITDGCRIKGTVRHSILFAGVTVEEGANVGAGSIITKNISSWALAITRAPLKVLENWVKRKI